MTSNKLPTSNTTELDFSEDEKNALKKHITEKIQGLSIKDPMNLGLFFHNIELLGLPHEPYTMEHVEKWNTWLRGQKESCVEKSRANGTTMPKVYPDKIRDFFTALNTMGLINQTDKQVQSVTAGVVGIIS